MQEQLVWTQAYPLSTYFAAYIDPVKSKPYIGSDGRLQNTLGLSYWIPAQRYIADLEDYQRLYSELELIEFVVNDPVIEKPLIKYYVEKGKKGVFDGQAGNGMIALQYTQFLMAYRKREDGLLGLESVSGQVDTRLSKFEMEKYPGVFPKHTKTTSAKEAHYGSVDGEFSDTRKTPKEKSKK